MRFLCMGLRGGIIAAILDLGEQTDRSRQRGGSDGQGPGREFDVSCIGSLRVQT